MVLQTGLANLTVVIPTYSREDYLLRQLEYWRDSDVMVVILDGSPKPSVIPPSLLSKNVSYVHSGLPFTQRLATSGQYVTTEYCAMLSDDEFFSFSGLRAAIRHLEENRSAIGCVGRCLYFFVDQGRFLLKDGYREWKPFSLAAVDQLSRLEEDLPPNKTHMAHYAIMRSAAWKRIMEDAYRQPFSCAYVYERLVNLQRSVLGRTEILDDLLWFRSMENRNISVYVEGGPGFLAWALDPKYAAEIALYRQIARDLLVKGGVDPTEALHLEQRFFEGGVQHTLARKSKLRKRFRDYYRAKLLAYSPKWFRLFVKRHLPAGALSFSGWEGYPLEETCDSLTKWGTRFEREEIDRVRELALQTASQITVSR